MPQDKTLEIIAFKGTEELSDFIRVPFEVYKDDPNWIPQLTFERKEHFSLRSNPYFAHAQVCFFVAYRGGKPVGRITAQIDNQEETCATIGHFGCLEATDEETLQALLEEAEAWLAQKKIKEVTGPYSLSINDEVGLLVDGFHSPPRLMMNYAPTWYAGATESCGYSKAKDLYAYTFDMSKEIPDRSRKMAAYALDKQNIYERPINMNNLKQELQVIMDIFNDAWADNWGFTPMTKAEIAYMAKNLRPILNPKMARILYVDDKPAGMIVGLPDINEALEGLGGQLLPFGWFKLLWRLKVKGLRGSRVMLMGVRKEYQGTRLGGAMTAALITRLYDIGKQQGFERMELSWILEENEAMRKFINFVGGDYDKTYRVFRKSLGQKKER